MIQDTSSQDAPIKSRHTGARRLLKKAPQLALLAALLLAAVFAYPSISRWSSADLTIDATRLRLATVERGQFIRDEFEGS